MREPVQGGTGETWTEGILPRSRRRVKTRADLERAWAEHWHLRHTEGWLRLVRAYRERLEERRERRRLAGMRTHRG